MCRNTSHHPFIHDAAPRNSTTSTPLSIATFKGSTGPAIPAFPKREAQENKSPKPGTFFHPEKVTAKTPRLPRIPPRSHHQKTISKHPLFAKNPCKNVHIPAHKKMYETIAPLIRQKLTSQIFPE
ncbi:hypothetical protein [Tunturibacter empetritectus]|uniref:Uncharacterized protein n=1 Tax=Tunturiibacter lichenicola TaxID=2051959 RepID=A0A7W8N3F7_9BACT|nr:hypothetical protein [Edaphobacter lichenicola]MBB5342451.1 hypothetical protein [Edaphobacter lichenicola]